MRYSCCTQCQSNNDHIYNRTSTAAQQELHANHIRKLISGQSNLTERHIAAAIQSYLPGCAHEGTLAPPGEYD